MWILVFLLALQASPTPCQASPAQVQSPSLIVQVVDPNWLPAPGVKVTIKSLVGKRLKLKPAYTDKNGFANFQVEGDADYAIEADHYGFKRERVSSVHLFKNSTPIPAYVQLKLRLSGPGVTVY
jgi:hypothetical protein